LLESKFLFNLKTERKSIKKRLCTNADISFNNFKQTKKARHVTACTIEYYAT